MHYRQGAILLGIGAMLMGPIPMFPSAAADGPPAQAPEKVYAVRGVLQSYDARSGEATIAHDPIPGYMPAMTMAYRLRQPGEIPPLQVGAVLDFQLHVSAQDASIDEIHTVVRAEKPLFTQAPPDQEHQFALGDLLPDIELVNQRAEKTRLSDFQGQAVALTFIYTRCPLPTYCPLITNHFRQAQGILKQLNVTGGWHFISVSMDPEHDTPAALAEVMANDNADPKDWTFASASAQEINRLGKGIGFQFSVAPNGAISHNLRTIIIDPSGRLTHIFSGNNWTPQELAAEVRSALKKPLKNNVTVSQN